VIYAHPENLHFECEKCGLCCGDTKQKTRHILILDSEATQIAQKKGCNKEDFAAETKCSLPYVYEMKKADGKCVFLKDNQCTIYEVRPLICRFYPFELKFSKNLGRYVFEFTLECPSIGKGAVLGEKDFEKLFALAQERLNQDA
jgi:Fe-S-cluster containining protein